MLGSTSHIALPGRFFAIYANDRTSCVSRKIGIRKRTLTASNLVQRIRQTKIPSGGFIVRTAGSVFREDLRQDARYLVRTWQDIKKTSEKAKSPAMVHQDLDLVQRLLRDQLSDNFTAIRVDSEDEYLRTVEFINRIQPRLVNRVKFYTRDQPILDAYNVQEEIDKALKPRVWLKSGGYLVINQTEALVAIDVNTGKFVGKGNARLEDRSPKLIWSSGRVAPKFASVTSAVYRSDLIDMEIAESAQGFAGLQEARAATVHRPRCYRSTISV